MYFNLFKSVLPSCNTRQRHVQNQADATSNSTEQEFYGGYGRHEQVRTDAEREIEQLPEYKETETPEEYGSLISLPSYPEALFDCPRPAPMVGDRSQTRAPGVYSRPTPAIRVQPQVIVPGAHVRPRTTAEHQRQYQNRVRWSGAQLHMLHSPSRPMMLWSGPNPGATTTTGPFYAPYPLANARHTTAPTSAPAPAPTYTTAATPPRPTGRPIPNTIWKARQALNQMGRVETFRSRHEAQVWLVSALMAYHEMTPLKAAPIADRILDRCAYDHLWSVDLPRLLGLLGVKYTKVARPVLRALQSNMPVGAGR